MLADPSGAYRPTLPVRPSNRGRVAVAVIAAMAFVGGAAVAGAITFDSGPLHPDEWDPRVAEIAEFVEDYRGHEFKHPVRVYFLPEERYREIAGGGENQPAPTADEVEASRNSVAQYRALGLMEGAPDLLAANETLQDSGTLAFYSPDDDVVNVRGTEMTVGLRVTLAHELTHALQDQYFDLSPIGNAVTADESGAARSIVEGDATSVESAYVDTLDPGERDEYFAESDQSSTDATDALGDVPDIIQVLFGSYYAVGNAFVTFYQAAPGNEVDAGNIDEVLEQLPRTSGQLFDPLTYLDFTEPVVVDSPDGLDDIFEASSFGTDFLFLMLAERIDPLVALRATDGWRGDSYVSGWTGASSDRLCVEATIELDNDADADEMRDALEAWTEALPSEADAEVTDDGSSAVGFRTCDPGPDADVRLTGQAGEALAYPVTRLQVAALGVQNGRSRTSALCYGNAVVEELTLDDLQADERTPAIDAALEAGEAACP